MKYTRLWKQRKWKYFQGPFPRLYKHQTNPCSEETSPFSGVACRLGRKFHGHSINCGNLSDGVTSELPMRLQQLLTQVPVSNPNKLTWVIWPELFIWSVPSVIFVRFPKKKPHNTYSYSFVTVASTDYTLAQASGKFLVSQLERALSFGTQPWRYCFRGAVIGKCPRLKGLEDGHLTS